MTNHVIPTGVPQITMFYDRSGNIPFWDDPSVYGGIDRPDNYQPRLDMMTTVADFYHKRFLEEDVLILSLIRDSVVLNENQLRRLLHGKVSSNRLSNRIRYMSIYGYTDRWKLKSREEGVTSPPSPWSVGLGGYLYLKHSFPDFVMSPEKLINQGVKAVQRYVAINEIRTQLYEYQALKGWKWHSVVGNNPKLGKPFAVGAMAGPRGEILLLFNRLQQGQAYMDHLMDRLRNWNTVFMHNNQSLPVMDFPKKPVVVAISVSSISMAQSLVEKIPVEEFKIPIWFIVDEYLEKEKLPNAVFSLNPDGLKKVPLSWLKSRLTTENDE
ncbi:hypothetical protein ACFYU8_18585 [Brevibacillus sp. NPDC003359]|uniref:hypothetical protein n=1 Tax=unclassified Brevibacillus TaxID=2684853 RepID=UPI0036C09A94